MGKKKPKPLTPEELEKHQGEPLPDREAMSVVTPMVEGAVPDVELGTEDLSPDRQPVVP